MSITKRALLGSGATLALTTAAFGQSDQQQTPAQADNLLSHEVLMVAPDGRMMKRRASAAGIAMIQKYGTPLQTGHALVYRDGDANYLLTNQKMADGRMLFDHRDEWYERS
jgi:hypothetical protein